MKRAFSLVCVLALLLQLVPASALAEGSVPVFRLPGALAYIQPEAFQGDVSIRSLSIPEGVDVVGENAFADCAALNQIAVDAGARLSLYSGAFANCTGLEQLVLGENAEVSVFPGAFDGCDQPFSIMVSRGAMLNLEDGALDGCGQITFYAHLDSPMWLYALSHGYPAVSLDSEEALELARGMVANYGVTPSLLQDEDPYETKRLIVRTAENHLPDISAYNPVEIVRDGEDTYYIQFTTNVDTVDCANALEGVVESVEPDMLLSSHVNFYSAMGDDLLSAAGTTEDSIWGTDDPMGFDYYSEYVDYVGSGSATIAVIDSGIARGNGYDDLLLEGVNMASDGDRGDWDKVYNYHGSIIASVIKSCVGNNQVRILPVRIEEATGAIDTILLAKAIDYAVKQGADIINLSMKLDQESAVVTRAINNAINKGVKVVAAAGNASVDVSAVYPANVPGVVAVAGIAPGNRLSGASGFGSGVSYGAPSESITHTLPGGISGGTSFAAPQIASALALLEMDPEHTIHDMNAACLSIDGAGKGMPQLNLLAYIPSEEVRIKDTPPSVMNVGDSYDLEWELLPKRATDKAVNIESSAPAAVSVEPSENSATLRAVSQGEADITLVAHDGESAPVTHHITVVQPVESVTIDGPVFSTWIGGDHIQFTATVLPPDATNRKLEWYSTMSSVATVNANGLVTPRGVGTTLIFAAAEDGSGCYGSRLLSVAQYPDAEGVVITDGTSTTDATAYMGANLQLRGYVMPETAEQTITWSVENGTGSATISASGLVTPTAAGTVTVHAAPQSNPNIRADFELTILAAPVSATAARTSTTQLYPGDSTGMRLTIAPSGAYQPRITWHSSNTGVATVDANTGAVKAVAAGTALIYATVDTTKCDSIDIPGGTVFESNRLEVTVKAAPLVTFEANDGSVSISNKRVYQDKVYGTLPTPTRPNYRFDGWYTAGGTRITAGDTCTRTQDFTLTAHWTSLKFTVTFNANGGSVSQGSMAATVNQRLGSLPTPTRDYYNFTGWYTLSSGGTQVTANTSYDEVRNVTVYAHWEEKPFQDDWSGWSENYCQPSWYCEVDTKDEEVKQEYTMYHYHRYIWYSQYAVSYRSDGYGSGAEYQTYDDRTRLAETGRHYTWYGTYHTEYTTVPGNTLYKYLYYDEWTSTETETVGHKTLYRFRYRPK